MKKKKKNSKTTIELYEKNLQHLMDISKFIDEDNIYPPETQSNSIFIKLLFQDIRKCSKWYDHDEWRPIKTAIHNCYKLLQNGYVAENQSELENNIKILDILLKESSYKKSNVDKITEEVMQNIFDKTLKNLNESNLFYIVAKKIVDMIDTSQTTIDKSKYYSICIRALS